MAAIPEIPLEDYLLSGLCIICKTAACYLMVLCSKPGGFDRLKDRESLTGIQKNVETHVYEGVAQENVHKDLSPLLN
jgi:hypothetical protein